MLTLTENTFAAACYDQNSAKELEAALASAADATDMVTWGLSEDEYFAGLRIALRAKLSGRPRHEHHSHSRLPAGDCPGADPLDH